MNTLIRKLVIVATGCLLFAQPVSAQPENHDHREKKVAPAGPEARDHRHGKKTDRGRRVRSDDSKHRRRGPNANDDREDRHLHKEGRPKGAAAPGHNNNSRRPKEAVPNGHRRHRRWSSYETPMVNRYWPAKGAVGTTVTINGANFSQALKLFIGDVEVTGAVITPAAVTFKIPSNTTNAIITLRDKSTALTVGKFEAVNFDARAYRKKRRNEHRLKAEADWKKRRKGIGKTRSDRIRALQTREAALVESRQQRRATRHAEIRSQFKANFLADTSTLAELALHAERVARLERMQRLAEANDTGKHIVRIDLALVEENERHSARLATLKTAFRAQ